MKIPTSLAGALVGLLPLVLPGLTLQDLSAPSGLPGASVTVSGAFNPSASHQVEIDGTAATVGVVTTDSLTFTVPAAATTGTLTVTEDSDSSSFPLPFVILREITGTFSPPPGVSVTGYFAGTGEDVRDVQPNGSFTALVEKGEPATVMVFRGENEPSYLTRLASTDNAITTDATSTAAAMVLTNPLVKNRDDDFLASQLSYLTGLPDFATLVSRITTLGTADYLDDTQVEDLLVSLVAEVGLSVSDPAASFKTGDDVATYGVKLRELNPDPTDTVNPIIRHTKSLNSRVEGIGDDFINFIYETDRDTRLDWTYSLNELDPFDFPGGIAEIESLDLNDPATAPSPFGQPLEHGYVRAKLDASKLDYFGQVIGYASKTIYGLLVDEGPSNRTDRFVVERQPPAIYMITATSGNFWYGTDWLFLGTNNQEDSIAKSDPGYQWELSAGTNAFIAATDAVSVILSIKGVGNSYARGAILAIAKTVTAYRDAGTPLSRAALLEISKKVVESLVKTHAKAKAKDLPNKIGALNLQAGRAVQTAVKQIDVLGKISKGLQALERGATLFSPGTLAMERSILVVGDPFAPIISKISPLRAREGEQIVISGSAFGTATVPSVSFCEFPNSIPPGEEPTPTGSPLPANVVSNLDTRLVIEVPAGFLARFPGGTARICIEKNADSKTDSYLLGDAGIFHLIDKPVVTAIDPSPEADGGVVTITGQNFIGLRPEVKVNGNPVGASVISDTQLLVNLPALSTAGSHNLTVAFGDDISAPFNFTVTRPVHVVDPTLQGGANIFVNELSMINASNDKLSLLEAFLLANGGLGRTLSFDESTQVGGTPGANRRDTINISGSGQTLALNQTLPAVASGDTIRFNGLTIDGSGLPAGTDGLILDGVTDARVLNVILSGFPGDGMRITNGSSGNSIEFVTLTGSGENGLFIRNDCDFNQFDSIEILGSTLDGLNFSDLCDHNTFEGLTIDGAGDDGAELNNGIDRNLFEGLTILNCGGDGLVLKNGAQQNRFTRDNDISMVTGTGIVLDGSGVQYNGFQQDLFSGPAAYLPRTAVRDCEEYGIRVENGASNNLLGIEFVSNCDLGGILIAGDTTEGNTVGRVYRRAYTQNDQFNFPFAFSLVANCGPGSGTNAHGILLLDSPNNTLTGLNISGCDGDAIRLSGATCIDNYLLTIRTGVSDFIANQSPAAAPNSGVGIRITNQSSGNRIASRIPVFIGTFGGGNLSYYHRNRIANDLLGGIVIENGSNDNEVLDLDIGGTAAADGEGATGGDGIAILSGSSNNIIGSANYYEPIFINACPGAAVRIDGAATSDNILEAMRIGQNAHRGVDSTLGDTRPNALGVVVSNGAPGTLVGIPGPLLNQPQQFSFFDPDPFTMNITGTSGAGVTLDGADGGTNPARLTHVWTRECETGLRITGGSRGNVIDFNRFSASGTAGIHIDANVIVNPETDRNRITRCNADTTATPDDLNLFDATAGACGLLISNGSSGNIVGEAFGRSNRLTGAIIDNSDGNWIRGNRINYYGPYNFGSPSSQVLGLLVRDSSHNLIGGAGNGHGNELGDPFFIPSSTGGPDSAGIAIDGGSRNTIEGNRLDTVAGNGVFLHDSSSNLVGGGALPQSNTIVRCLLHGVRIDGQQSQNNHIQGNDIGTNFANANFGNTGDGVRIEGAASANIVGGFTSLAAGSNSFRPVFRPSLPAGNRIAFNGGDGVAVSGASSIGNPITLNGIHSNGSFGIGLPGGGNNNVSLSTTGTFGGGVATGTVTDLASVPVGSTLHFYGDRGSEGEVFLASTTVETGGTWLVNYPVNPFVNMNVTATTPDPGGFGDTTPFASIAPAASAALTLTRADGASPGARTDAFDAGQMVVAVLRAGATGSAAQITGLTLQASGGIDESADIDDVVVFLDQNLNGQLDPDDPQLGDPASFPTDDGTVVLTPDSLVAPENGSVDFLIVYQAASPPASGGTVELELTAVSSVDANFVLPLGPATPSNPFPVSSDLITLGTSTGGGGGTTFAVWQAAEFPGQSDPAVIGELADPDMDGVVNIFEFLFGTDPNDPTSFARPMVTTTPTSLTFEFPQAKNLEGITPILESSYDMNFWETAFDATMTLTSGSPVDTVSYTLPRTARTRFLRLNTGGAPGITFADWQAGEFPGQSDLAVIGPNADPDGDGCPNLLEFLTGTDPNALGSKTGPRLIASPDALTYEIQRAKGITGIRVELERSGDLTTWSAVTGVTVELVPGATTDTLRFILPRDGNTGFLRLNVSLP